MIKLLGKVRRYWNETVTEVMAKTSWPTFGELGESTVVVIIAILLLGVFVFLSDFSLHSLIQALSSFAGR